MVSANIKIVCLGNTGWTCSQTALNFSEGVAVELLFAYLCFAVTRYFVAAAAGASNGFCYHATSLQ